MSSELLSIFGGNGGGVFVGIIIAVLALVLILSILMVVSLWKIFTKAGQPGWAAIIPFYGNYVLVQVARLPVYYFIIMVIPSLLAIVKIKIPSPVDSFVGIITFIVYSFTMYNVSKQFGKGVGYTLGMIFLPFIFYPMLAFGDSVYQEKVAFSEEDVSVASTESIQTESVPIESASAEISTPVESPTTATIDQTTHTAAQQ